MGELMSAVMQMPLLDPAEELAAAKADPNGRELSPAAQALYEAEGAARFAAMHGGRNRRWEWMTAENAAPGVSLLGLGQSDCIVTGAGDVDQRVPVPATGAQEEAAVPVNLGLNGPEHDAEAAGATGPHAGDATPCGRPSKGLCSGGPECWCKHGEPAPPTPKEHPPMPHSRDGGGRG